MVLPGTNIGAVRRRAHLLFLFFSIFSFFFFFSLPLSFTPSLFF
jgi:hypothetical protein